MLITFSRNFSRISLTSALIILFLTGVGLPYLFNIRFASPYPDFVESSKLASNSPAYLKIILNESVDRDRLVDEVMQVPGVSDVEDEYPADFFYWNSLFYIPFGELVVIKDSVIKDDIKGVDRFLNYYASSNNPLALPLLGQSNKLQTKEGKNVLLVSLHELDPLQYLEMHKAINKITSNLKAELVDPYYETIKFEEFPSILPGIVVVAFILFCSLVVYVIYSSWTVFFINSVFQIVFYSLITLILVLTKTTFSMNLFISSFFLSAILTVWLVSFYTKLNDYAQTASAERVISFTWWFSELRFLYYSIFAQLGYLLIIALVALKYTNWHIFELGKLLLYFVLVSFLIFTGLVPLLCSRIKSSIVLNFAFLEKFNFYRIYFVFGTGIVFLFAVLALIFFPYSFKTGDVVKHVWNEPEFAGNIFPSKSLNHVLYISNALSLERASSILQNHGIKSYNISKFAPDSLNERLNLISSIRDYCKKKNLNHDICYMARFTSFSLDRLPYVVRHFYNNRIFIEDNGEQSTWSSIISIKKTFNARLVTYFRDLQIYKTDLLRFIFVCLMLSLVLLLPLGLRDYKNLLLAPLPILSLILLIAISLISINIFYPLTIILLMNLSILLLLTQGHIFYIHGGMLMELLRRVRNHILIAIFVIIAGIFVLVCSVFLGFIGLGMVAFIGLLACSSILIFLFPHIFSGEDKQL